MIMEQTSNNIVMNMGATDSIFGNQPESMEEVRKDRKIKLAAALRLFGKFGFDEGVAGHITVRDPEKLDHFWVNPMGKPFKLMTVSDLLLVSHEGEVVEGSGLLNGAAFT
ncbi:MAG: ribulose-5-phosphate 4-epimerase/fuculose-1-phosphate aldolase, partial [Granulosicoccus sp.]